MPQRLFCKWFGCKEETVRHDLCRAANNFIIEKQCKRCKWPFDYQIWENGNLFYRSVYQTQDSFLKDNSDFATKIKAKANRVLEK